MYTIHNLLEMQMTGRTPTVHVPREVVRELGRDGRDGLISALEAHRPPACGSAGSDLERSAGTRRQVGVHALRPLISSVAVWLRRCLGWRGVRSLTVPGTKG